MFDHKPLNDPTVISTHAPDRATVPPNPNSHFVKFEFCHEEALPYRPFGVTYLYHTTVAFISALKSFTENSADFVSSTV